MTTETVVTEHETSEQQLDLIAITSTGQRRKEALALADNLSLPFVKPSSKDYSFLLVLTNDRLELQQSGARAPGPVTVDFLGGRTGHRAKYGGSTSQAIARAVGVRGNHKPRVIDACAGLASDAFVLACLGCHVSAVERSPIIAALVHDGLLRATADPRLAPFLKDHFELVVADAKGHLQKLNQNELPDVVYLDPMFPERKKSALVKKEMRALAQIVGEDNDTEELLRIALEKAKERVVVKRPRHADHLGMLKPHSSIAGKTTRFDIYTP